MTPPQKSTIWNMRTLKSPNLQDAVAYPSVVATLVPAAHSTTSIACNQFSFHNMLCIKSILFQVNVWWLNPFAASTSGTDSIDFPVRFWLSPLQWFHTYKKKNRSTKSRVSLPPVDENGPFHKSQGACIVWSSIVVMASIGFSVDLGRFLCIH